MPPARRSDRHELALRDAALAYPETHEAFPWADHRVVKVRKKMFVVLSHDDAGLSVSVKLPWSAEGALQFPFCEPTGYGLGASGWVTATFEPGEKPPLGMLRSWIDESYRAVAPKRVVATLAQPAAVRVKPARTSPATQPAPPRRKQPRPRASAAGPRGRAAARSPR